MRVLVVEDEPQLAASVARGLQREGFAVDLASDGATAIEKAEVNEYQVVILDRDLPVVHGDDVCRRLVAGGNSARILMLTAAGEIDERVAGLSIGADDYLAKPFAFAELVARTRALARRSTPALPPVLRRGDLTLDPARRFASRAGGRLDLGAREFAMLEMLLGADGAVVSAEVLLEGVWDEYADPFSNVVAVTINRLRRKLGDPPIVETVVGAGYRLR